MGDEPDGIRPADRGGNLLLWVLAVQEAKALAEAASILRATEAIRTLGEESNVVRPARSSILTQPQQQVQVTFCPQCGLARAIQPLAPSKLTVVGAPLQIAPCPFCVFRADVVANLERAEQVIRELQGMASPVIEEADAVKAAEAILEDGA